MKLWQIAGKGFCKRLHGFRLTLWTGNVLRVCRLLSDGEIEEKMRVRYSLKLLLGGGSYLRTWLMTEAKQRVLLLEILDIISFGGEKDKGGAAVSFERDGALIYAALLQSYKIDLIRDKIDWRAFPSLVAGIGRDTVLYEVMQIRVCELPAEPGAAARMRRLKSVYSLSGAERPLADGLNALFDAALSAAHGNAIKSD